MKPYQINATHALDAEGNFPGRKRLPPEVLDRMAELKIKGGYTHKRNPLCPRCYVRRSNNGSCHCE